MYDGSEDIATIRTRKQDEMYSNVSTNKKNKAI